MSDEDLQTVLALGALGLLLVEELKKKRRRQMQRTRLRTRNRSRVKSWIQQQTRGAVSNMCHELEFNEISDFKHFDRLFPTQFQKLKQLLSTVIKQENRICIGERLMITMQFLVTGESFSSLSKQFRVGIATICRFVPETCEAIYRVLNNSYLKCPDTVEEWQNVADGFQTKWNFPNCIGALDGKHINIRPPPGTESYNSIELMGLVDSNYRFLYVDVGCNGQISNGGLSGGCSLQDALVNRTSNIPGPAPLPGSNLLAPYCIVADEAFPLKEYLMKPYPNRKLSVEQRIYNYRLSRARKVVENAFGILASRFRVLLNTINIQDIAKVENIVLACCALHNLLCTENCDLYMAGIADQEGPDHKTIPGRWREESDLQQASLPSKPFVTAQAKRHRDELCRYFNSDIGAVPYQWGKI